ncbi:MAG TPA: hypothetical protein VMF69_14320, partial [Gemmataceae bacterium]|nr:hypothetical protein [Gemmataceae bacterium]
MSGRQLWKNDHAARSLVVAPDGRTVCTDAAHNELHAWEANTGREIKRRIIIKKGATDILWARPIAFTSDGRSVLLNSAEGLFAWDLSSGYIKRRLSKVDRFVLAPDGKTAITLTGSLLQRWDEESGRPLYPDTGSLGHASPVVALAFSPDGR